MNLKSVAATLLALELSVAARAITPVDPNSDLQKAGTFAMGGIGIAGTMSEGERALRKCLKEPNAASRLENMIPNATPAGKLYALIGLRSVDRVAYARAFDACRTIDTKVSTMHGCLIDRESFRDLVQEIDRGVYDTFLAREWPGRGR